MALSGADEPAGISHEEARQELFGHGPSRAGLALYEVIVLILGMVGAAIAFDQIDNWSQWVVLAAIIVTVIGFMIAVSPSRRASRLRPGRSVSPLTADPPWVGVRFLAISVKEGRHG